MRRAPASALALALVLAAAALLSGCSGPLLYAELEVPSLRATLPSQDFPASGADPAYLCQVLQYSGTECSQMTLDYDLGGMVPILNEPNVTYDLRLTDVAITLTAASAGTDLSGIVRVSLSALTNPDDPTSTVIIAQYFRPASGNPPSTIAVTGNSNIDIGPYLQGGKIRIHAEFEYDKATPEFTADVTSGFSLLVKLDYGSLL